jgi:hypothetical protein
MTMNIFYIFVFCFIISVSNLLAEVPHTFNTGDPVSASKMNENFSQVGKRFIIKNNGSRIGFFINIVYPHLGGSGDSPRPSLAITDKGYLFPVMDALSTSPSIATDQLFSADSNCSSAYPQADDIPAFNRIYLGKNGNIYYASGGDSTVSATLTHYFNGSGGCTSRTSTTENKILLKSNIESTTGFPATIGTLTVVYE